MPLHYYNYQSRYTLGLLLPFFSGPPARAPMQNSELKSYKLESFLCCTLAAFQKSLVSLLFLISTENGVCVQKKALMKQATHPFLFYCAMILSQDRLFVSSLSTLKIVAMIFMTYCWYFTTATIFTFALKCCIIATLK